MPEFNGTAQRDSLEGSAGVDTLSGRDGSDTLLGGAGDDLIYGDRGDDTLSGGAGADIFASFAEAGLDRVIDFNRAEGDRVRLDAGSAFTVSQQGADTVVEIAGGARVVLVGVTLVSLDSGWIFVG
jgi:serralysin